NALDGSNKVPRRRVRVRIRFLKVHQVGAAGHQQAVDVEHVNPRLRFLKAYTLINQRRTEQIRQANARGACTEEQILFVLEFGAFDLAGVDHAGEHDGGSALHVVVIDAVPLAVTMQQVDSVRSRPVLKMDAAFGKYLLHRFNELIHKREEL